MGHERQKRLIFLTELIGGERIMNEETRDVWDGERNYEDYLNGLRTARYKESIELLDSVNSKIEEIQEEIQRELLAEIEKFIQENKRLAYTTREEFIRDAARWRLKQLRENTEYVEIPKDKYERLEAALEEMNAPYLNAEDFINKQIEEALEKYDKWQEEKEEHEQRK